MTDEEARSYLDAVAKYELEFIYDKGKPYDGVLNSLKKLKENGYYTAVCSNSSRRYITMVLEALGLMPYIDFIQDLQPNMTKVQTLALLLLSPSNLSSCERRSYKAVMPSSCASCC